MPTKLDRRDFLKLMGVGGAVFASGLGGWAHAAGKSAHDDFFFVQLSDAHWGFKGPKINPDAAGTLQKAIAAVNALKHQPDFIVFTGDLTHSTDDAGERRRRMAEFQKIVKTLKVQDIRFLAGENDAALDGGEAFQEFFGDLHYAFDHKGVHFVALDNVSDPRALVGDDQLQWLRNDLKQRDPHTPIVVFTHRPLFDLYPAWDWSTRNGAAVMDILTPYPHVTVFYGHIHQENHHLTGHIAHHAAKSLIFPLPAPGSMPKRAPLPWNPAAPYQGLGFRRIEAYPDTPRYAITEKPLKEG